MISTFNSLSPKKELEIQRNRPFFSLFRINESLSAMQSIARPATRLAFLVILLGSQPAQAKTAGSSTTPIDTPLISISGEASIYTAIDTTVRSSYIEEAQLQNALKSEFLKFRGLTQIQSVFVTDGEADGTSMTFRETNLRLGVRTAFDSPLNAVLQLDFSQEPNFLDAFITYAPNSTLSFKAGAFKLAQNLDVIPDAGTADFLTRGVLVRELLYPRDIGIQASLNFDQGFTWHVGLLNGDRLSSSPDNKMLFITRLEKGTIDIANGSLRAGVYGHIGQADRTSLGQFRQIVAQGKRRHVGMDGRFVSPDWIFAAEMAFSQVETAPGMDKLSRFFGYMATAGYQFNTDQQLFARFEYFERSRTAADGHYTVWSAGFKQKLTELFAASVNSNVRFDQDLEFAQFGVTATIQFRF